MTKIEPIGLETLKEDMIALAHWAYPGAIEPADEKQVEALVDRIIGLIADIERGDKQTSIAVELLAAAIIDLNDWAHGGVAKPEDRDAIESIGERITDHLDQLGAFDRHDDPAADWNSQMNISATDEDRLINEPPEMLSNSELRRAIADKAAHDLVLKELLKGGAYPTGEEYLSLNYYGEPPEWFEGDEGRIRDLLDEYHKRVQPADFRRVRFERELAAITNGADPEVLTEEQLHQLIKLLFARQREVGRDSDEGEEINNMLSEVRSSSREAEALFDRYDDKLNY